MRVLDNWTAVFHLDGGCWISEREKSFIGTEWVVSRRENRTMQLRAVSSRLCVCVVEYEEEQTLGSVVLLVVSPATWWLLTVVEDAARCEKILRSSYQWAVLTTCLEVHVRCLRDVTVVQRTAENQP